MALAAVTASAKALGVESRHTKIRHAGYVTLSGKTSVEDADNR